MMEGLTREMISAERMTALFKKREKKLTREEPAALAALRRRAIGHFSRMGFPTWNQEAWKNTDLTESLGRVWDYKLEPLQEADFQKVFRCNIPHLDTAIMGMLNGWYVSKDVPLMELGNGIIMGSLAEAKKKYPDLIEKHYGKYADDAKSGLTALNSAFALDGIFIYVPDQVRSPKPVQMINVIQSDRELFLQSRNLILLGRNSSLSVVHCDDSYNHNASFSNIVTEIHLDAGARMDHYKLQNLNNSSTLVSSVFFGLEAEARLDSHFLSLNGGLLRNNVNLLFNGPQAEANLYGLYLMDRKQHIDNHLFVDHLATDCSSKELFKGILDENASGVFNGHVLVRRDAQRTNAYQSNRNILLTDTAKVNSKPFLEIYADDVKCSHGSTTGQLDPESMFYLRQRGISEESARMLLMYAFADEIVSRISIPQLKQRIEDMVKKRLQGELQICEQCVLHCNTPEHPVDFRIDLSRI
jgi:Fe-S cluster assembly protein SufD